jgi:hypothetical protein
VISRLRRLFGAHAVSDADLSAYVDGELPAAVLQVHIDKCESCLAKVAELRSVKSLLGEMPRENPGRSFVLSPEIAFEGPAAARRRAGPVWAPALALSVLVLLLAADLGGIDGGGSPSTAGNASLAAQDKASGGAETSGLSNAAPAPRAGATGAQSPVASQAQAAVAAPNQVTPPASSDTTRPSAPGAASPVAAPAAAAASTRESGSGWSVLRLLEVLSALTFAGSLVYLWWYRQKHRV